MMAWLLVPLVLFVALYTWGVSRELVSAILYPDWNWQLYYPNLWPRPVLIILNLIVGYTPVATDRVENVGNTFPFSNAWPVSGGTFVRTQQSYIIRIPQGVTSWEGEVGMCMLVQFKHSIDTKLLESLSLCFPVPLLVVMTYCYCYIFKVSYRSNHKVTKAISSRIMVTTYLSVTIW